MKQFTLAAFSAERRHAAIAIFQGTTLEDIRIRCLPTDTAKAVGSVSQMATKIFEDMRPEFVAIKAPSSRAGTRTRKLIESVSEIAGVLGIPTVTVDDATLLRAYGHPPLILKDQLYHATQAIWPVLQQGKPRAAGMDAAATGLYFQIERVFNFYKEEA